MLREYLISEAMHALGIPTTRSLAVATTGEPVFRETPPRRGPHPRRRQPHPGLAPSNIPAAREDPDRCALADTPSRHFPEQVETEHPDLALLEAVVERQASLIAHGCTSASYTGS